MSLLVLAAAAGIYFKYFHSTEKKEPSAETKETAKEYNSIKITANDSANQQNIINQPNQTNNIQKGDVVNGAKTTVTNNNTDNSTKGTIIRNDTDIFINAKPEPRTATQEDIDKIQKLTPNINFPIRIFCTSGNRETKSYAEDIRTTLLKNGFTSVELATTMMTNRTYEANERIRASVMHSNGVPSSVEVHIAPQE